MLSSLLENDTGYAFQTTSVLYLCCTLLLSCSDVSHISYGQTLSRDLASLLKQQDYCISHLLRMKKKVCLQPKHVHLRALSASISTLAFYSYVHELNKNIHN